jgi:hypothetical protein
MDLLDQLAEARIAEAVARGDFEDLPGAGRPLALDDDALVPEALRVAYRILKNAGYVPEEVRLLGELRSAAALFFQATGVEERSAASARLRLPLGRLGTGRARSLQLQLQQDYFERLLERLDRAGG